MSSDNNADGNSTGDEALDRADDDTDALARDSSADGASTGPHSTFTDHANTRFSFGFSGECPHCQRAIEEVVDTRDSEVVCSQCEGHFFLVGDDQTISDEPAQPQLDRYEIDQCLGRGGYGTVWKAFDKRLQRMVAVKIPHRSGTDSQQVHHALREARAAAHLSHPNIVGIHDVGQQDGVVYIVSDLIEGEPLSDWNLRVRPSFSDAVAICRTTCDALQHAHQSGVVHRDLKPSNIMIDESGQPHIMDFGLARREIEDVTVTVAGVIMGTPAYMSPEQAEGRSHEADARSDIYSLGATLFELLTGERPFHGNRHALMNSVIHEDPPSPRKYNRRVPRDLETISLKCLEKRPARRYQTAQQVRDELARFESGEPIRARPIGRLERGRRWCARRPLVTFLTAVITIGVGCFLALATWTAINRYYMLVEQERQTRLANINWLSAESRNVLTEFPQRGLLLAAEAVDISHQHHELPQPVAVQALRDALAIVGGRCLSGHDQPVASLAVSPDGRWLATGSLDTTVCLWDLQGGDSDLRRHILSGHEGTVHAMVFTPDGRWLATGAPDDPNVRLWNLASPDPSQHPRLLPGHAGYLDHLRASGDGRWLVTSSADAPGQVWDLSATVPADGVRRLDLHQSRIEAVAICPNSRWLVTSGQGLPLLWDLDHSGPDWEPVRLSGAVGSSNRLVFSAKGRWLAGTDNSPSVFLWDLQHRDRPAQLLGAHAGFISALMFSPDESQLVSTGYDSKALVWNLDSPEHIPAATQIDAHTDQILDAAISPDGKWLATASRDNSARLWDLADIDTQQRPVELTGHAGPVTSILFAASGELAVTAGGDKTARIWNLASQNPALDVHVLRGHEGAITEIRLDSQGHWLATASGEDNAARLWDLNDLTSREESVVLHRHAAAMHDVTIAPNGRYLVATGDGGGVFLWQFDTNPADGRRPLVLNGHQGEVRRATICPNSRWLVTQGADETTRIWDLKSSDPAKNPHVIADHPIEWRMPVSQVPARTMIIDPTGSKLVTVKQGTRLCMWDLNAAPLPSSEVVLLDSETQVTDLAFDSAGEWLWYATGNKTQGVIGKIAIPSNMDTPSPVIVGPQAGAISSLQLGSDDGDLITVGTNKRVRRWRFSGPESNGEVVDEWEHTRSVAAASIDPRRRWLMTSSLDNSVRLFPWPADGNEDREQAIRVQGNDRPFLATFAGEGDWLVTTGGGGKSVLLWDLRQDEPASSPITLFGNQRRISRIAMEPHGEWLVTAGEDGTVRMWELRLDALLDAARRIAGRQLTAQERIQYTLE